MIINSDKITTTANTVTGISALLASQGVYPQYTAFLAAFSHFISGYFTNKAA